MAVTLLTPTQIGDDYLDYLKALQPSLNTSQQDTDWWIRSRVVGGVVAGVYADNMLISNDALPLQARHDALAQFLQVYFGADTVQGNFLPATQSQGYAAVTGNPGQVVAFNLQAIYGPNGNAYTVQENTTLDPVAGTGLVPFVSVALEQSQNLQAGALITFPSPPVGLNANAVVASGGFSDATDPESDAQAVTRIITRIRNGISVGRVTDYIQYAKAASPSVTSATVSRFPYGLGTVAVYITSGTTDIDAAINAGEPISLLPSEQLIATVQAYLDINSPITDCVTVLAPIEIAVPVTVLVSYAQGDGTTILQGQTLTQDELVQREVMRAIYKTPIGGFQSGASGFVLASYIEQTIDVMLSDEGVEVGSVPILLDRQVQPLSGGSYNYPLNPNQIAIPGAITIGSF